MSIVSDEFVSDLLCSPEYLPDVLKWYRSQPRENGHISKSSMETILKVISFSCWRKFRQAAESSYELVHEDFESGEFKLLTKTGIAYLQSVRILGKPGQAYNLILTDTAKQIFRTIDVEEFQREKKKSSSIHHIAAAAVNAYGMIEENQFVDLLNCMRKNEPAGGEGPSKEPAALFTLDEVKAVLAPYSEMRIDVLLVDGYLVNRMLYNGDPDDIPRFFSNVSADKYYKFDAEQLLAYADAKYFEPTPQILRFLDEVKARVPDMKNQDLYMVGLVFVPCYLIEWPQLIEISLCPLLKSIPVAEQEKVADFFVEAIRSARSWNFRGFSENEIFDNGAGKEDEVREFMKALEAC